MPAAGAAVVVTGGLLEFEPKRGAGTTGAA